MAATDLPKRKQAKAGRPIGKASLTRQKIGHILTELLGLKLTHNRPREAVVILDAMLKSMTNALQQGEEVSIQGFGKFKLIQRQPRACNNLIIDGISSLRARFPEPVKLLPRMVIVFYPALSLKASLNLEIPNCEEREAISSWSRPSRYELAGEASKQTAKKRKSWK